MDNTYTKCTYKNKEDPTYVCHFDYKYEDDYRFCPACKAYFCVPHFHSHIEEWPQGGFKRRLKRCGVCQKYIYSCKENEKYHERCTKKHKCGGCDRDIKEYDIPNHYC